MRLLGLHLYTTMGGGGAVLSHVGKKQNKKHNTVSYHNLVFEQSLYMINAYKTSKSAVLVTGAELDWQPWI